MNCNEFKEKVADLFDKNIDLKTQRECNEHIKLRSNISSTNGAYRSPAGEYRVGFANISLAKSEYRAPQVHLAPRRRHMASFKRLA